MSLVVNVREPKWFASSFSADLQDEVLGLTFTNRALGGYWDASWSMSLNKDDAEEWFDRGLGCHVEIRSHHLELIWSGFVNSISLNMGFFSATRGPLIDTWNKVNVKYTPRNNDANPPVAGTPTKTGVANDTDSQDLYGIREKVLSTGDISETQAQNFRDTFLAERKNPELSRNISSGASSAFSLRIECAGYVQMLNWPFSDTTAGTVNASTRITDVLGDDPELSWNTNNVDTSNTTKVEAHDDEESLAWSAIQDAVAIGGASNKRWLFFVRGDLGAWYEAAPTTIEYQVAVTDQNISVTEIPGSMEIEPWRILPGKWILISDFLPGRTVPSTMGEDPRNMFIEQVKFTAPRGFSLDGGKADRLPQLVEKLNQGGLGS